jgi:hypothetical protein
VLAVLDVELVEGRPRRLPVPLAVVVVAPVDNKDILELCRALYRSIIRHTVRRLDSGSQVSDWGPYPFHRTRYTVMSYRGDREAELTRIVSTFDIKFRYYLRKKILWFFYTLHTNGDKK